MKKISIIVASLLAIGIFTPGCKKYFEDKIASPNSPTTSSANLLLTNIEIATFANFSGQLARQGLVFNQQIAGTSNGSQSAEIARYVLTDQTNENEWGVIYSGVLFNGKILIEDFGAGNPYYTGIARVIMAMNLGSATDLWGDVPYSDALKGREGEYEPNYDTQESLLDDSNPNSIFGLLDQAIADLTQPMDANTLIPADDDLIFGGDPALWLKTAYTLKARYYNRLSERDPQGSATNALAALASGIAASSENCNMVFGTSAGQLNQWYDFEQNRAGYYKMGSFFVELLKANNDPRLPFYAEPVDSNFYSGTPKDQVDSLNTSSIGEYLAGLNSEIPLVSYAEAKFIEAEAQLRNTNAGDAAIAYNAALTASVTQVTGDAPDSAFSANFINETAGSITLEKIMTQKYIALFGQLESYADFRRTDLPAGITPNPKGSVGVIPVRFVTPQNERLYNSNATVVSDITKPVYWDN